MSLCRAWLSTTWVGTRARPSREGLPAVDVGEETVVLLVCMGIVMAAGCTDGLPDHGQYASLLTEAGSPAGLR